MNNNARGNHLSPGIYKKEVDMTYAVKSLGVTTLGVAGETLKGPAFQPVLIQDWTEYTTNFGGTSPAKFKDSQYPKYELPYIAKSYLKASKQLYVTRVLGLSGYNAGPAFVITGSKSGSIDNHVIAVLRPRGYYEKYSKIKDGTDDCGNPTYLYDNLVYTADSIEMSAYTTLNTLINCNGYGEDQTETFEAYDGDYGKFNLVVKKDDVIIATYPVSLNAGSKDYILNVLGSNQSEGDAAVFVDELYDVAWQDFVKTNTGTVIDSKILTYEQTELSLVSEPVANIMNIPEYSLKSSNAGQTFLASTSGFSITLNISGTEVENVSSVIGDIYEVVAFTKNGKKTFVYKPTGEKVTSSTQVLSLSDNNYYMLTSGGTVEMIGCDMNNYKEQFRYASTPWFISEIKGNGNEVHVNKLFRFHTITDGNYANTHVKISIENISLDSGTFDIVVRDFFDSDSSVVVLEKYNKCNMIAGDSGYIGYKIGTVDGSFEAKSKYVTVEIVENDVTQNSIPCGYLGYPVRNYVGLLADGTFESNVLAPEVAFNTVYDNDIKDRRQYFGMSDLTGIDVDVLTYKGKSAYNNDIDGMTPCFHMDSRLSRNDVFCTVDGVSGFTFKTVSSNNVTQQNLAPIIGSEADMVGTIYENEKLRKFTACPYGGFDGWDIYRGARTNSDEFKFNTYADATIQTTGEGKNFGRITNQEAIGLTGNCITSDYYAYLAGIRQYSNPEDIDINVFATPGIDYVNNPSLVNEALDMIEDERMDSVYIITTPDKTFGASDDISEMFTETEVSDNLNDSDIDTSYAATYYPWIKYFDADSNKYINLPVTKDIVRNLAITDNVAYPWYAAAGTNGRGNVDCVKAHKKTTLAGEDILYGNRINPIKTFAVDGVTVWGNLTMYKNDTPLNRLNVRRLMIKVKKTISIACNKLVFEQDDDYMVQQFKKIVEPILANLKANRGIYDSRIDISQTAENVDRHELVAKIWIKPTSTLEYIDLTFNITPSGAVFND